MIDTETFDQILEMDDDDEQSFSRNIIEGFFEQAQTTFKEMDVAMWVFPGSQISENEAN